MIQAAKNEANTGLGRLGFKMLVRGGELLHVHKELLDEIFTELDLNELGVLSFTEIWYARCFRVFLPCFSLYDAAYSLPRARTHSLTPSRYHHYHRHHFRHWFILKARTIRGMGGGLHFTMPDIVPPSERAKLVLIRRFAAQEAQQHMS